MRKSTRSMIVLVVIAGLLTCAVAANAQLTNFLTEQYSGGTSASFTLGYQFTVGASDINVTALGRSISIFDGAPKMDADHAVRIWSLLDTTTPIAMVTLQGSLSSNPSQVLGGYAYEMLAAPVTLTAGTSYRIACDESSDPYHNFTDGSLSHLSIATIDFGVYGNPGGYPSDALYNADSAPTFFTGSVSVPEPGSLISLFGAIAGIGTLVIRRRRA